MDSNSSHLYFLWFFLTFFIITCSSSPPTPSSLTVTALQHVSGQTSICSTTPHPQECLAASNLSLSPSLLSTLLRSLDTAISETTKLSSLFSGAGLVERRRGALQDCKDLHQITLSALRRSMSRVKSSDPTLLSEARTFLGAALTNRATCLEGLASASGPLKPPLVRSVVDAYKHVANSLSLLSGPGSATALPSWLGKRARRPLEVGIGGGEVVTVAKDGTGNFTTVGEAVSWAPRNGRERTVIYVKQGVYEENVEIASDKTNIVLLGDGTRSTFITGSRSVVDGWTTFRSATLGLVSHQH